MTMQIDYNKASGGQLLALINQQNGTSYTAEDLIFPEAPYNVTIPGDQVKTTYTLAAPLSRNQWKDPDNYAYLDWPESVAAGGNGTSGGPSLTASDAEAGGTITGRLVINCAVDAPIVIKSNALLSIYDEDGNGISSPITPTKSKNVFYIMVGVYGTEKPNIDASYYDTDFVKQYAQTTDFVARSGKDTRTIRKYDVVAESGQDISISYVDAEGAEVTDPAPTDTVSQTTLASGKIQYTHLVDMTEALLDYTANVSVGSAGELKSKVVAKSTSDEWDIKKVTFTYDRVPADEIFSEVTLKMNQAQFALTDEGTFDTETLITYINEHYGTGFLSEDFEFVGTDTSCTFTAKDTSLCYRGGAVISIDASLVARVKLTTLSGFNKDYTTAYVAA